MKTDFMYITSKIKNKEYKCLGKGSGRKVYDIENGYVVKVAMNRRGIAQNITEYSIGSDVYRDIFPKIIEISDNKEFLIMERAETVYKISEIWKYFKVKNNREMLDIESFRNVVESYGLIPDDLYRASNWGIIKGKPVIIDFGFTNKVYEKHYKMRGHGHFFLLAILLYKFYHHNRTKRI